MKRLNLTVLLAIVLTVSGLLHLWEYRKIREISETLQVQAEIEVKRTSLMVIYQEVLQNLVREVENLLQIKIRENKAALELLDTLETSGKLNFGLPDTGEE